MISTFIGAAHFENGVLSIEPNSRNLIIYADNTPRDDTISVRGPYTVDIAIENESNQIRMPSDAMMSLGVRVNDTIQIGDVAYIINETRPGENDVLRVPLEAKDSLNIEAGDVIQNSRLKEKFAGSLITHTNHLVNNTTITEMFFIVSKDTPAYNYEIIVDNVSMFNSSGIFKLNDTYNVLIDGQQVSTIYFKEKLSSTFNYDNHEVKIIFKNTNSTSIKSFATESKGNFLNIVI